MSRTALIVQARMNSSRLPGKVMRRIAGRTILEYVLARCRRTPGIDALVCATVDTADCDPVAEEARRAGATVFRGSELDVIDRYLGAARAVNADVIMRVTSDCPLIDPLVCGAVLRLRAQKDVDYACNNMPPSWPHGLDCEAFTRAALERADAATKGEDREYPTRVMRSDPRWSKVSLLGPGGDWANMRLTLDTPADWAFFEALIPRLSDPLTASLAEVAAIVRSAPGLAQLVANETLHHGLRRETAFVPYTELLPAL